MSDKFSNTPRAYEDPQWSGAGTGVLRKASQIVFARTEGDLELIDRKVFNFLLYHVFRVHQNLLSAGGEIERIPVSDLLDFLGHSSTDRLNESLSRLSSLEMMIDYVDEAGVPNSARAHYISYNMEKSIDGVIHFAMDPILLRFLHSPAVFSRLHLGHVRKFRSTYAALLYEIMSLYVNRHHKVWQPTVDEFRAAMQVGDGYQRFDNLRKRIIDSAVEEVNEIAPFNIDVELVRGGVGGKVTRVRFTALPKGPKSLLDLSLDKSGKKDPRRDPNTPDLFDSMTDEQRYSRELSDKALQRAASMLPQDEALDDYVERWKTEFRGRKINNTDRSFLNWLDIQLAKSTTSSFDDISEDTISSLLESWESR